MDRRKFIKNSAFAYAGLTFTSLSAKSINMNKENKLGIALVGMGYYSTYQLAPALEQTEHCYLAGIVSGTAEKRTLWSKKGLVDRNIYTYEDFDRIADNDEIDIVYVVLPNALHKEFVVRAAKAGKHVICEKPLGISSNECLEMIQVCERNNVQLSVGYRNHFDPYHQYAMELGKTFKVRYINADFGYVMQNPNEWRMKKNLAGGGALMNVGIYCIQSACYITGERPTSVTAQAIRTKPEFFTEVEETLTFQLHFEKAVPTNFTTSHNLNSDKLIIDTDKEKFQISPAYAYDGLGSRFGTHQFNPVMQQSLQMDDFAVCIKKDGASKVSGKMGLRDACIMEAIYEAADTGQEIEVTYKS